MNICENSLQFIPANTIGLLRKTLGNNSQGKRNLPKDKFCRK